MIIRLNETLAVWGGGSGGIRVFKISNRRGKKKERKNNLSKIAQNNLDNDIFFERITLLTNKILKYFYVLQEGVSFFKNKIYVLNTYKLIISSSLDCNNYDTPLQHNYSY